MSPLKLYILLISFAIANGIKSRKIRPVVDFKYDGYKAIAKLLNYFSEEYAIFFHYENSTIDVLDEVVKSLKILPTESSMLLYNYDTTSNNHSPARKPFLHTVIMENPLKFSQNQLSSIFPKDIALFISRKDFDADHLITTELLDKLRAVYLIKNEKNHIKYYNVCSYCGRKNKLHLLLGGTGFNNFSFTGPTQKALDEMFKNFRGHTFNVAFAPSPISFDCFDPSFSPYDKGYNVDCSYVQGVEYNMLKALATMMNFTFQLVRGLDEDVGPGRKAVLDVHRKVADFGMGDLSISEERSRLIEYSTGYGNERIKLIYGLRRNYLNEGLKMVLSFDIYTWSLLVVFIVFSSILVYYSSLYINGSRNTFTQSIWIFGCPLFEQSIKNVTSKRLTITWIVGCVIITTAYKAKLSSLMTNPAQTADPSLENLIDDGYGVHLNEYDSSLMHEILSTSRDPVLNEIAKRATSNLSLCEAAESIMATKSLMIEELDTFYYYLTTECLEDWRKYKFHRLRLLHEDLFPVGHAWVFQKDAPYVGHLNINLMRISESGLIKKWKDTQFNDRDKKIERLMKDEKAAFKRFTLEKFLGPLLAWGIGIALSIICFICELIYFHVNSSKKES